MMSTSSEADTDGGECGICRKKDLQMPISFANSDRDSGQSWQVFCKHTVAITISQSSFLNAFTRKHRT